MPAVEVLLQRFLVSFINPPQIALIKNKRHFGRLFFIFYVVITHSRRDVT
jgi:hypothetical protein